MWAPTRPKNRDYTCIQSSRKCSKHALERSRQCTECTECAEWTEWNLKHVDTANEVDCAQDAQKEPAMPSNGGIRSMAVHEHFMCIRSPLRPHLKHSSVTIEHEVQMSRPSAEETTCLTLSPRTTCSLLKATCAGRCTVSNTPLKPDGQRQNTRPLVEDKTETVAREHVSRALFKKIVGLVRDRTRIDMRSCTTFTAVNWTSDSQRTRSCTACSCRSSPLDGLSQFSTVRRSWTSLSSRRMPAHSLHALQLL